jgi:hypothetical protein
VPTLTLCLLSDLTPTLTLPSLCEQIRLAAAAPAMVLTSLTYVFIGAHHWRKGASAWAVMLDTALSAALALPVHLTALAIAEVSASRSATCQSELLLLRCKLAESARGPMM